MITMLHPRSWSVPVRIFVACVILSIGILAFRYAREPQSLMAGLQSCARTSEGNPALMACTRRLVRDLLDTDAPTALLSTLKANQVPKAYGDCHAIAHVIGQETYARYDNIEQTLSMCGAECFDGCLHGALSSAMVEKLGIQEANVDIVHMDPETIVSAGGKYCRGVANMPLCHGMGHLLYTLTGDFVAASAACEAMATDVLRDECLTGVYMQGVGGITNSLVLDAAVPTFALVPENDYGYPCNIISQSDREQRHSCFKYLPAYQRILFERYNISDPAERLRVASNACETFSQPERAYCFEGLGRFLPYFVQESGTTTAGLVTVCTGLRTESDKVSCTLGHIRILRSYGRETTALAFCSAIPTQSLRNSCFFSYFSYYGMDFPPRAESACAHAVKTDECLSALSVYAKDLASLRKSGTYSY